MITALLVVAVAAIVGFGVALTVRARRDFAAQNEVVPGRASPAPASWAGSHDREAKLHRRIGAAVRSARAHPRMSAAGLEAQLHSIDDEAIALDERLVATAALAEPHRTSQLDEIESAVDEIEATIAGLVTALTDDGPGRRLDAAVAAADERLAALAAAREEIERVDADARGEVVRPDLDEPAQPGRESRDTRDEPGQTGDAAPSP